MTLEDHPFAGLGPRGHANVDLSVQCRHANPSSEQRSVHGDPRIVEQVGTLTLEVFGRGDADTNEEVARGAVLDAYGSVTLPVHSKRSAILNTWPRGRMSVSDNIV